LRLFGRDDWTLGWGGRWYTAYLDDDPFWDKFLKAARTGTIEPEFWKKNGYEIPIAISVAVPDPVKPAKFRKELKDYLSGEPCNPIQWEQREHQGISYMRLHATAFETAQLSIYSLALPDQWLISLNERVVQRAIDRHLARKAAKRLSADQWLGDTAAVRVRG